MTLHGGAQADGDGLGFRNSSYGTLASPLRTHLLGTNNDVAGMLRLAFHTLSPLGANGGIRVGAGTTVRLWPNCWRRCSRVQSVARGLIQLQRCWPGRPALESGKRYKARSGPALRVSEMSSQSGHPGTLGAVIQPETVVHNSTTVRSFIAQ